MTGSSVSGKVSLAGFGFTQRELGILKAEGTVSRHRKKKRGENKPLPGGTEQELDSWICEKPDGCGETNLGGCKCSSCGKSRCQA